MDYPADSRNKLSWSEASIKVFYDHKSITAFCRLEMSILMHTHWARDDIMRQAYIGFSLPLYGVIHIPTECQQYQISIDYSW